MNWNASQAGTSAVKPKAEQDVDLPSFARLPLSIVQPASALSSGSEVFAVSMGTSCLLVAGVGELEWSPLDEHRRILASVPVPVVDQPQV